MLTNDNKSNAQEDVREDHTQVGTEVVKPGLISESAIMDDILGTESSPAKNDDTEKPQEGGDAKEEKPGTSEEPKELIDDILAEEETDPGEPKKPEDTEPKPEEKKRR